MTHATIHARGGSEPSPDELSFELKAHFGLDAFRPGQREVIAAVLSGRNTVAVMPTGAGKSLCYQLPAMVLKGVTVVVSPLIALMHDQVDQLNARGIAATFINSTLTDVERASRQRRLKEGAYRLIYVAPERFKSDAFLQALRDVGVALFAIDEAHCISQWGHDFRPDYALLGQVRRRLLPPRTVALTATATPEVRDDIVRILRLKDPQIFVAGFDRPNLFLEVASVSGDAEKRDALEVLSAEGSGLVYCATRRQAEQLHRHLECLGRTSVLYHAGLPDDARKRSYDEFMSTSNCTAVATNAFGMGIDKPDIRFVAHAAIPRAVEAYAQEIGRAGRDGKPSRAVLLFNHADVFTQERLIRSSHPPQTLLADVWKVLRELHHFDRGIHLLAAHVGSSELEISAALKILERAQVITRAARGEGPWGVTLLPAATTLKPKGPQARVALAALTTSCIPGGRATFELPHLASQIGLDEEATRRALALLEKARAITVQRPFAGRSITVLSNEPWDRLGVDLERVREHEQHQLLLLKRMTDYAYSKRCRRAFLLRYFGEWIDSEQSCGTCDVCAGASLASLASLAIPKRKPQASEKSPHAPPRFSSLAAEQLKRWRRELSQDLGMPPYLIFNDATLYGLAAALPITQEQFLAVKGTSEARWERFGPHVRQICLTARAAGDEPQEVAARSGRRRTSESSTFSAA